MLTIIEHSSPKYGPRTYANAGAADLTVAFAVDFSTFGEKATHKAAGLRYVGIPLSGDWLQGARLLYRAMRGHNAKSLNVAGNGIYTLDQRGWTQAQANEYVYRAIAKVHEHWPIESIRSGGQTGIDIAGLVAARVLGIPATGLLPKGFLQRTADKVDRCMTEADIRAQIDTGAAEIRARLQPAPSPAHIEPKGSIRVVSKRQGGTRAEPDETVIDGDRSNPVLGNRHHLQDWKDAQARHEVIERYRLEDFEPDVLSGGPIYQQMQAIAQRVCEGEHIAIACWCKPLPCHLDPVAEGIEKLARGIDLQAELRAAVAQRTPAPAVARERQTSLSL